MSNALLELAKRCESATGPDRELDALIDAAVWRESKGFVDQSQAYTSSLDTAMTLVPAGHDIKITQASGPDRKDWYAHCKFRTEYGDKPKNGANALGPALALCASALRARAALKEEKLVK